MDENVNNSEPIISEEVMVRLEEPSKKHSRRIFIIVGIVCICTVAAAIVAKICLPTKATKDVIALIDSIGEVSLSSQMIIGISSDSYDALTPKEQAKVDNYDKLVEAKASLKNLQDKETVKKLIGLIEDLRYKECSSLSDIESSVKSITSSYNSLDEKVKKEVTNYSELNYNIAYVAAETAMSLFHDYNYSEGKAILDKYGNLMDKPKYLLTLATMGRWKCFQKASDDLKKLCKNPYSYTMQKGYARLSGYDEKHNAVDIEITFTAMNGFGGYRAETKIATYWFDMDISTNTISNIDGMWLI